jgi:hypothetical protein
LSRFAYPKISGNSVIASSTPSSRYHQQRLLAADCQAGPVNPEVGSLQSQHPSEIAAPSPSPGLSPIPSSPAPSTQTSMPLLPLLPVMASTFSPTSAARALLPGSTSRPLFLAASASSGNRHLTFPSPYSLCFPARSSASAESNTPPYRPPGTLAGRIQPSRKGLDFRRGRFTVCNVAAPTAAEQVRPRSPIPQPAGTGR